MDTLRTFTTGSGTEGKLYSLPALAEQGFPNLSKLPVSIRIVLESVLRNSEIFASKWGHRTMEHWLYAFKLMGLIENRRDGLHILREPNARDYELCAQQSHMPYANTRRVIDLLNARVANEDASPAERRRRVDLAQKSMLLPAAE